MKFQVTHSPISQVFCPMSQKKGRNKSIVTHDFGYNPSVLLSDIYVSLVSEDLRAVP